MRIPLASHLAGTPIARATFCPRRRYNPQAGARLSQDGPHANELMSTLASSISPAGTDRLDADAPVVSVVIPCLNEAENIETCVVAALEAIVRMGVSGEVVVADNDSEDDSAAIAERAGARVVVERRRGYGSAYLAGFAAARGRYIVMADADLTYDFKEIPRFVAALDEGAEMVIGDRMDNIQARRDAVAAPLRRQPGAHRPAQPVLPHRHQRRPLRHARGAPRRAAAPGPAHDGHGVRLRDGDPGLEGEPAHRRVPDRIPPARRREQAVELPRRLAPPALPARPQPQPPVHRARRDARRRRHADRRRSSRPASTSSAAPGACTR